jgi:hypothetical protein
MTSTLPNKPKSKGSYPGNGEYDELIAKRVLTLAMESMTSTLPNKTKTSHFLPGNGERNEHIAK